MSSSPYDLIVSRDNDAFPFEQFLGYPRCFMIDWRAAPIDIAEDFIEAAGLTQRATLALDTADPEVIVLRHVDTARFRPNHPSFSPQHQVLKMLQMHFGIRHSIRLLNHVTNGDTAYCVVEPLSGWERLEKANPHVRWFFTPYQLLPDIMKASYEEIAECGRKHAGG
jgi:hypothetical protein